MKIVLPLFNYFSNFFRYSEVTLYYVTVEDDNDVSRGLTNVFLNITDSEVGRRDFDSETVLLLDHDGSREPVLLKILSCELGAVQVHHYLIITAYR